MHLADAIRRNWGLPGPRLDADRRALAGDPGALADATRAARGIARASGWRGDPGDLVSAALAALAGAALAFDPGRGVPFRAFARRRVEAAVIDEMRREVAGGFVGGVRLAKRGARVAVAPAPPRGRPEVAAREDRTARVLAAEAVRAAVDDLPPTHRAVIRSLHGIGGPRWKHSRLASNRRWPESRVREIEAEALAMLRGRLEGEAREAG